MKMKFKRTHSLITSTSQFKKHNEKFINKRETRISEVTNRGKNGKIFRGISGFGDL